MYLYDYGDDNNVEQYLRKLHINLFKYESDYLSKWMKKMAKFPFRKKIKTKRASVKKLLMPF